MTLLRNEGFLLLFFWLGYTFTVMGATACLVLGSWAYAWLIGLGLATSFTAFHFLPKEPQNAKTP